MSAAAAALPAPRTRSPYLLVAVVGASAFMEVLDTSIANVSLSHIAGSLSVTQDEATWVLTSYLVANAIILPMTGWLATAIGRRRYYIGSMAVFVLASVLSGLAPSLQLLVAARVLQGLAGGALQPVSQAILNDAFPPAKRGMAMAIYSMAMVCGPAFGPPLGGWITDSYSWHWVFLINAPIGALLITAALRVVKDSPQQLEAQRRRREEPFTVDYLGFALIVLCIGALQMMLDKGQQEDWLDSAFIRACLFVSVSSLVALIVWELRHPHPVVNLRLLKNPNFAIANLMMLAMGVAVFGVVVLLPQFTQTLLGYSAFDAGLIMTPAALMMFVIMPASARITARMDPRLPVMFGFISGGLVMLLTASYLTLDVSQGRLMGLRMLQMFGLGFTMVPITLLAYVGVPPTEGGNASALINLTRNLGSSIGVSLAVTLLARGAQAHQVHLIDRVSVLDPAYQQSIGALGGMSELSAQATLGAMVQQQAMLLSYADDFYLFAALSLLSAPLILLARKPPANAPAPPAGH